jgi:hypothetical protein
MTDADKIVLCKLGALVAMLTAVGAFIIALGPPYPWQSL